MYILGIETTGAFASVALVEAGASETDAVVMDVIHGNDRFSHLQNLTPQIQTVLNRNDVEIKDLGAIAVSHGPGSFTGIRIGVSTGRAISQVTGIPCVAVSSLEALALRTAVEGTEDQSTCEGLENRAAAEKIEDRLICPVLDARRKQVYGGAYRLCPSHSGIAGSSPSIEEAVPAGSLPTIEEIVPAGSYLMTEFLEKLDQVIDHQKTDKTQRTDPVQILFLGDGIDTCGEIIESWQTRNEGLVEVAFAEKERRYQDAATVALRGWQLYKSGRSCGYLELEPEYLRMAEAEKKLRERMKK